MLTGTITRIIDHDTFAICGDEGALYVIYVGSATRLTPEATALQYADLTQNMRVSIRGSVAADPAKQCSVGARQVVVQRR